MDLFKKKYLLGNFEAPYPSPQIWTEMKFIRIFFFIKKGYYLVFQCISLK